MNTADDEFPPMAPDEDETLVENSAFFEFCRQTGVDHADRSGGELGQGVLTWSERWGFIWRADFSISGQSRDNVNRIVIWGHDVAHTNAAIAIGIDLPPLSASAP